MTELFFDAFPDESAVLPRIIDRSTAERFAAA